MEKSIEKNENKQWHTITNKNSPHHTDFQFALS